MSIMAHEGQRGKDNGEDEEHVCLDEADEQLEQHKDRQRDNREVAREDDHDEQQDFTGKTVTEETQGKGRIARYFTDQLEHAFEGAYRITEWITEVALQVADMTMLTNGVDLYCHK